MKKMVGFSLLELMVVLAIVTVVSVIVAPSVISWRSNAHLRGAAGNLRGDFELSKAKAIRERSSVTITFTATHYRVTFTDKDGNLKTLRNRKLPGDVRVDLDNTKFGDMGAKTAFDARGLPSDFGRAVLVNKKGQQKDIIVSRLGRIRIE